MTPEEINAEERAIEALIGASLNVPDEIKEVTDDEIKRYVEQGVTLSAEERAVLEQSKSSLMKTIKTIVFGNPQPGKKHVTAKYSKGVFYRRAAFDAYVINALSNDPNLGRTKIEKITHLAEYHCGIDFERAPVRDAAGPVDYVSRIKTESLGGKLGWYVVASAKGRLGKEYVPGPNFGQAVAIGRSVVSRQKDAVDALLQLMCPLDTKDCELVATLYAAWNDLLLCHRVPDDAEIISEAREYWHPEKLKVQPPIWAGILRWMHERNLVPSGKGKRVLPPD